MNPHYGCDDLNPICKPPSSETEAQCVCTNNADKCDITISTICDASGTASTPMDGTCKCGMDPFCDSLSNKPSCLLSSDGQEPSVGATEASCQVYRNLFLFNSKGIAKFSLTGEYFIVPAGSSSKIILMCTTASTL